MWHEFEITECISTYQFYFSDLHNGILYHLSFFFFLLYRQGTQNVTKEFKITTGMKLTRSQSLTTRIGFEYSLKSSVSAGIEGLTAGMESQYKISTEISTTVSSSEEKFWSKETTTTYTAPAGKKYRVLQTLVDFSSPLDSDNCCLYCVERVEED